jgi:hypothetical protein
MIVHIERIKLRTAVWNSLAVASFVLLIILELAEPARAAPGCELLPGRRNHDSMAVARCEVAREFFQTNGCVDCTRVDSQRSYLVGE